VIFVDHSEPTPHSTSPGGPPSQNPINFTAQTESRAGSASLISQERFIVFLAFATFYCFRIACYLFTVSRWASVSSRIGVMSELVATRPHHQGGTPNSGYPCLIRTFSGLRLQHHFLGA